jgi:hypothetical protein
MVFSNNLLLGAVSAAASDYLIEQSALFDGSSYLSRTPSTAGNRKTWTFSCWVKRSEVRVEILFSSGNANTDDANCYFVNGNVQVLNVGVPVHLHYKC